MWSCAAGEKPNREADYERVPNMVGWKVADFKVWNV